MNKVEVLVLGGGPAGLSAGYTLKKSGVDVKVYDKNDVPGGLCRSFEIKGFTFDTFAHVNFCKDEYVKSMLEERTEYLVHSPEAYNYSNGKWIRNPVQNNLIPLDTEEKINIIKGFIERKPVEKPENYEQWLRMNYGDYFACNYPYKYTRKYWTVDPDRLEPKWVEGRMYTPTIDEILRGAMRSDTPNVHYSKEIHYPKYGGFGNFFKPFFGEWVESSKELLELDHKNHVARFDNGEEVEYDKIISTIPLNVLINSIQGVNIPSSVISAADKLDYTSGVMVSIGLNCKQNSPALWFYIYDEDILPARVYCPDIKSPNNVPNGCSALQAEVYFSKYKPLSRSIEEIGDSTVKSLIDMKLFNKNDIIFTDVRMEKYANIMFTPHIYSNRKLVHDYLDSIGILYAGRFGEWDYLWTGQSILSGKKAADNCMRNEK